MSERITTLFATYQASITPGAIEIILDSIKDREYAPLVTPGSIRLSAAMTLHDAIGEEIARANSR